MRKILTILLSALLLLTSSQSAFAVSEVDTETFLTANFDLQESYSRVLCVGTSCPSSINATVPCLTDSCANTPQSYNIHSTYNTIQAASEAGLPGDLIIIMPGTYDGVSVEEKHGANNAYIHFKGWGEPGTVIVNAPAEDGIRHHFYFINTRYYIIENIAFQDSPDGAGVFFSGYFNATGEFSHHLIVMNIYSHDNYKWGLHTTQASYVVIQDSVFTGSEDEHGAYISGGGDKMVIRRNVFQGNNASGLQVNADPQTATMELFYYLQNETGDTCGWTDADVEFTGEATWHDLKQCYDDQELPDLGEYIDDGISEDLIIEQNVMTGNGSAGGGAINLASVRNSTIRNNLVYGNLAGSITCWDNNYVEDKGLSSSEFGCDNVRIVHNTVVEEAGSRSAVVFINDARNMTVYNNIIVRNRADAYEIGARSGQGLRSGANYYFALSIFDSPGVIAIDTDANSGSVTGFSVSEALANFTTPNANDWVLLNGQWPQLSPNRPDFRPLEDSILAQMANVSYMPATDFTGSLRSGSTIGAFDVPDGVIDPTATPGGPTETPQPTATTNPSAGIELLVNTSFELDADDNKIPDGWTEKNLSRDKVMTNKPDKTFAYDGERAWRFKGVAGESSKIQYKVPEALATTADVGDTLELSAYISTTVPAAGKVVSAKAKYANGEKLKLEIDLTAPTTAYQFFTQSGVLAQDAVSIKAQLKYRVTSGKVLIDVVSLELVEAVTLLPLP